MAADPRILLPLALIAGLAAAERLVPARQAAGGVTARQGVNLVLGAVGWGLARLLVPAGLVAVAVWADRAGFGLLNWVGAGDGWLLVLVAWLVLDCAIWFQHLMFHKLPWLWRLHRVHHTDTVMDFTTGVRFHPGEIAVSLAWKGAVIAMLGAPPAAVLLFESMLAAMALITHANIRLPGPVEQRLRWVLVTPALHLVHHHPDPRWTDSTYGNLLSVWDRLAGTLRSAAPDERIGLDERRGSHDQRLTALLAQPFQAGSTTGSATQMPDQSTGHS
jgi:sterol desaturase/sphingolipid hydroxylase (fatty acid hydroxylase superfamily)